MPSVRDSDDQPRRLLVLTYHFTPDGSVGGLRWGGMTKYLARRGWEVHVITAAAQDGQPPVPGVHVHHCPPSRTLNDFYNVFAERARSLVRGRSTAVSGPAPATSAVSSPATEPPRRRSVVGWVRSNVSAVLVFPDYAAGWIGPAARMARTLMKDRPFDAVVSSGPPHSAHLASTLSCVGRPHLLSIDMRDPWAALLDKSWTQVVYNSAATRGLIRRLERVVFRRARRVITNTPEFAADVRRSYPGLSVAYVPNGIDPERLPPEPAKRFEGLSIAYAGTLYLSRNLSPIVRALEVFLGRYPQAREAVKLRVAGSMDADLETRFRQEVNAAGLDEMVEILGRVSGAQALDLINRSHLTLVLAQDQPTQIPAKLYECVAMGVTTLVIGESTSAAAREARRIGAVACEVSDIEGISRIIERLWLNPTPTTGPTTAIDYDAISAQMDALLRGDAPDIERLAVAMEADETLKSRAAP